mmetsp:Transcript_32245/g.47425  ORF Transcript_32245/g.47425 Transcript_32245/m.47425 type:complete len:466 (+) Transcript_32245:194-1591(+)
MSSINEEEVLWMLWTSKFLQEYERPMFAKESKPSNALSTQDTTTEVVFGRTTHFSEKQHCELDDIVKRRKRISVKGNVNSRQSDGKSVNSRDNSISDTLNNNSLSGQETKYRGRQMTIASQHDIQKAQEKRKRQLRYAKEIGASGRNAVSLQVDSITRVVVQGFRKLIDCERCALFLMDRSTNELYFNPVGDEHTHVQEIRFPATSGVAGWVASNKQMLNIKNAYHDSRFNHEIDKQTNFRTRTILCMPVTSSQGDIVGVIQMVNKKKRDAKALRDKAKKKKSDEKNHGYQSSFEPFSEEDEEILKKCCDQVSRALASILKLNKPEQLISSSTTNATSVLDDGRTRKERVSEGSINTEKLLDNQSCTVFDKRRMSNGPRRCSIGSLVQFVNAQTGKMSKENADCGGVFGKNAGITEALQSFEFRSASGPQISVKGNRQDDFEQMIAAAKRKRMVDYTKNRNKNRE